MNTLIIYDSTGYVISQMSGPVREPVGIPFIWVEVPTGKQIKVTDGIGVNVSVTPNLAFLEDIPPTETEILQSDLIEQNQTLSDFMDYVCANVTELH
jgi:hypothetical protein